MTELGIVLPTYNEASNLPRLIESLEGLFYPEHPVCPSRRPDPPKIDSIIQEEEPPELKIFVVDDNSPDGTSGVAQRLASQYGNISVITRPGKEGLGSALRDGMKAALAEGCDYVLTMDADLSHSPEDVPRLLAAAQAGHADLVQASRYVKGGGIVGLGFRRRLQSRIANLLCRLLLGLPLESTTDYRVYNRRSAQLMVAETRGRDFEFQPECILIAMKYGLRIVEVPIIFTGRAQGKSKLGMAQNIKWALFFIGAVISLRLRIGRFSRLGSFLP